jgi:hypothetical protein
MCALLLAACSAGSGTAASSSGTATARSTLCQGVAKLDQALTSLSQIGSNTTVGEAQAKQRQVGDALNSIEAQIPAVAKPLLAQLQAANDQLAKALQGYPSDATIGEASIKLQGVQQTASAAQAKTTQLASLLKCSS